jgi:hypothetical protein
LSSFFFFLIFGVVVGSWGSGSGVVVVGGGGNGDGGAVLNKITYCYTQQTTQLSALTCGFGPIHPVTLNVMSCSK